MRFFVCLVDLSGHEIPDHVLRSYESLPRKRALRFRWHSYGRVSVLVAGNELDGPPLVAVAGEWVAVGPVRLDNASEIESWFGFKAGDRNHLELVLHTLAQHSANSVPRFLGDFAFVVVNSLSCTAISARDAFGLKKLYYTERKGLRAFASRGEALSSEETYNEQYLVEEVAMCVPSPGLSVYGGVKSLPAGTCAVLEGGKMTTHRYWSAYDFVSQPPWVGSERDVAQTCRELLIESVRLRLTGGTDTWAQLSGGLDSSSVVGAAQWLQSRGVVPCGLGGTVTYVDTHGTGGDEREYSEAVAERWHLRNEPIIDAPVWQDDQYAPPELDEPNGSQLLYPRERRLSAIVQSAGGRVLLTGVAGDTLFTGTMFFFADWLARGRVGPTLREMARRAARGRVSFWELAYRNALLPLLPGPLQQRLVQDAGQIPPWLLRGAVRQYELHDRSYVNLCYGGRVGHKYRDATAAGVEMMAAGQTFGVLEDLLDVRHPYLYRPLVEFALRLPPELCVRPQARKWVLREAMRGLLPNTVQRRVGKGALHGRLAKSLITQREVLEPLIEDPILGELGLIDAACLRAFVRAAQREPESRQRLHSAVHHTLAVEAWLQMRSGRWPCRG